MENGSEIKGNFHLSFFILIFIASKFNVCENFNFVIACRWWIEFFLMKNGGKWAWNGKFKLVEWHCTEKAF